MFFAERAKKATKQEKNNAESRNYKYWEIENLKCDKHTMRAFWTWNVFSAEKWSVLPSPNIDVRFQFQDTRKSWMKAIDNFLELMPGVFFVSII